MAQTTGRDQLSEEFVLLARAVAVLDLKFFAPETQVILSHWRVGSLVNRNLGIELNTTFMNEVLGTLLDSPSNDDNRPPIRADRRSL
jgi:hypothetical protein